MFYGAAMQVSWAKGIQAKVLDEHDISLPLLHVQESVGSPQSPYWLRFEGVGEWKGGQPGCAEAGLVLEVLTLHVHSMLDQLTRSMCPFRWAGSFHSY